MKNKQETTQTTNKENAKKKSTKKIFSNNKFLLLLSFLLACGLWMVFSQQNTQDMETLISNIPVTVELSDQAKKDGFKVYQGSDSVASVRIKGSRSVISSVTADDIQVVTQDTASILTATRNSFSLIAKKNPSTTKAFEIISLTPEPNMTYVYIDRERQDVFTVESEINTNGISVPKDYYISTPMFSNETVTITGPETEIKKIDRVVVKDSITGEKTETITENKELSLLDSDGVEISKELFSITPDSVDVTIRISPKKEVPLKLAFATNSVPDGIDAQSLVNINPSVVTITGSEEDLAKVDEVELSPMINFSTKLLPSISDLGEFTMSLPSGVTTIDGKDKATVTMDWTGYTTKTVTIESFSIAGLQMGYEATVATPSIDVEISGPETVLEELTADNIVATANLSDLEDSTEALREVPVVIRFSNAQGCWTNKSYTVIVSIAQS